MSVDEEGWLINAGRTFVGMTIGTALLFGLAGIGHYFFGMVGGTVGFLLACYIGVKLMRSGIEVHL